MKKFKVKRYEVPTKFGTYTGKNVAVLCFEKGVNRDQFNPKKHDHGLADDEALRLEREAAEKFINERAFEISAGKFQLTPDHLAGFRLVLGINATQFAELLGITKGTMSKLLRGTIPIKRPESILAVFLLTLEIATPGRVSGFFEPSVKSEAQRRRKFDELIDKLRRAS